MSSKHDEGEQRQDHLRGHAERVGVHLGVLSCSGPARPPAATYQLRRQALRRCGFKVCGEIAHRRPSARCRPHGCNVRPACCRAGSSEFEVVCVNSAIGSVYFGLSAASFDSAHAAALREHSVIARLPIARSCGRYAHLAAIAHGQRYIPQQALAAGTLQGRPAKPLVERRPVHASEPFASAGLTSSARGVIIRNPTRLGARRFHGQTSWQISQPNTCRPMCPRRSSAMLPFFSIVRYAMQRDASICRTSFSGVASSASVGQASTQRVHVPQRSAAAASSHRLYAASGSDVTITPSSSHEPSCWFSTQVLRPIQPTPARAA